MLEILRYWSEESFRLWSFQIQSLIFQLVIRWISWNEHKCWICLRVSSGRSCRLWWIRCGSTDPTALQWCSAPFDSSTEVVKSKWVEIFRGKGKGTAAVVCLDFQQTSAERVENRPVMWRLEVDRYASAEEASEARGLSSTGEKLMFFTGHHGNSALLRPLLLRCRSFGAKFHEAISALNGQSLSGQSIVVDAWEKGDCLPQLIQYSTWFGVGKVWTVEIFFVLTWYTAYLITGGTKWWKWVMSRLRHQQGDKRRNGSLIILQLTWGVRLDRGSTFLTSLEVEVHERGATWYLLGGFFQCREGILGCEVARISASRIR